MLYELKPYLLLLIALATHPASQGSRLALLPAVVLFFCGIGIIQMRTRYRSQFKRSSVRVNLGPR